MKKLSIIIPTFNRASYLKCNLELIIPQVEQYKNFVEIVVCDNASKDETNSLMLNYLTNYNEIIKYYRHNQTIEADANFQFGVEISKTEYVYILGDDDIIAPNFLLTIFEVLDKYPDVGLLHFNYIIGANNFQKCFLLNKSIKSESIIEYYECGKDFLYEHLSGPSFISSNIIKKSTIDNGIKNIKDDCDGYQWFSILAYSCLNEPCIYYSLPLVIQGCPPVSGYSKKWPVYILIGMPKLFLYLDNEIPGIYIKFMNRLFGGKYFNYYGIIANLFRDQTFYLTYYNDFIKYAFNSKNKLLVFMLLRFNKLISKHIGKIIYMYSKFYYYFQHKKNSL